VHLQRGEAISLEPLTLLCGIDIGAWKVKITIYFKAVGTYCTILTLGWSHVPRLCELI